MKQMETTDPFSPLCFGSRPSFAAYWPDTRFIELRSNCDYFERLLGRKPKPQDKALLQIAGSVVHHERVHWQIAHSLSWGIMRSQLISMKTTLASIFFRTLEPVDLQRELASHGQGIAPIARDPRNDLIIKDHWLNKTHTLAEHAWLCGILVYLIDRGADPLATLRPPDFMVGVTSQYLAGAFDPYSVVFSDDAEFRQRVSTFKRQGDGNEPFPTTGLRPTVQSIEECLALIGQLHFLRSGRVDGYKNLGLTKRFVGDILNGVFAEPNHSYARCFEAARATFKQEFEDLNLALLRLICELSLDPPLPFDDKGVSATWDWSSFHPAHRFTRLLQAAVRIDGLQHKRIDAFDSHELRELSDALLIEARLSRAETVDLLRWLETYDEDTTEWPSQELAWQHVQFSKNGRATIERSPGILFDFARMAPDSDHGPFFDLPYVIVDGQTHTLDVGGEPEYRVAGRQILNGHLSRATDYFAFGRGALDVLGLPTDEGDSFSMFADRLHEFFNSAWHAEIPKIKIRIP